MNRRYAFAAMLMLGACGCGASMNELREHHVWERAICEATEAERPAVRADIERDQRLTYSLQAVPPSAIEALGPEGEPSPLADFAVARVRARANETPVAAFDVATFLVVDGARVRDREVSLEELARRTGETLPPTRQVTRRRGGGGRVGPVEAFFRLVGAMATLGLSELLIRSARGRSTTVTEHPDASEIAAAAPHAYGLAVATSELIEDDGEVRFWRRPPAGVALAVDVEVTLEGRDQRSHPCEWTERLRIPLEDGLSVEEAIERRFGHREHTLSELRAMADG